MKMKSDLARLSLFAGIRFDLVQAGGGNSSIKIDETQMLVKASGINLSQVTAASGFVAIDYKKIRSSIQGQNFALLDKKQREIYAETLTQEAMLSKEGRASIETFLHAILNTHTLHTHPIVVNTIAAQDNWDTIFKQLFPGCLCVKYATPGIDLAVALIEEMQTVVRDKDTFPEIVFLQNHGLIVSSTSVERVMQLTDEIVIKLEKALKVDLQPYRAVGSLHNLFDHAGFSDCIPYLTEDMQIQEGLHKEYQNSGVWAFCPDTLIYCHVRPVFLKSIKDSESLDTYIRKYHAVPKVVIVNHNIYCVGTNLKKCREIEELLKFHLMAVSLTETKINRLSMEEVAYLDHWDAEKYRQEL